MDRLLEGEDAGEVMGGYFAGAVADHRVRGDPEMLQLLGERNLNGEVGGLRESVSAIRERFRRRGVPRPATSPCSATVHDRCAECCR